ncbi:MAG: hypothetical protein MUF07_16700 [Steroidobacteraceae bacterium]|jgi:hypothetical protein|nr:hypothetical protein [Steroidobacteraceae bacterium]
MNHTTPPGGDAGSAKQEAETLRSKPVDFDWDERRRVEQLLWLVNTRSASSTQLRSMLKDQLPSNADGTPYGLLEPVEARGTGSQLADQLDGVLEAVAADPRRAWFRFAPILDAQFHRSPLMVAKHLWSDDNGGVAAVSREFATTVDSMLASILFLLLDPHRAFGAALARCSFDGAVKGGDVLAPPCRHWFLRLPPTARGGRIPKWCSEKDAHRAAQERVEAPKRVRRSRSKSKKLNKRRRVASPGTQQET